MSPLAGADVVAAVSIAGGDERLSGSQNAGVGRVAGSSPVDDSLPVPVTGDDFAELREHSPFLRTLNISRSLILTGVARIEEDTIATLYDFETRQS